MSYRIVSEPTPPKINSQKRNPILKNPLKIKTHQICSSCPYRIQVTTGKKKRPKRKPPPNHMENMKKATAASLEKRIEARNNNQPSSRNRSGVIGIGLVRHGKKLISRHRRKFIDPVNHLGKYPETKPEDLEPTIGTWRLRNQAGARQRLAEGGKTAKASSDTCLVKLARQSTIPKAALDAHFGRSCDGCLGLRPLSSEPEEAREQIGQAQLYSGGLCGLLLRVLAGYGDPLNRNPKANTMVNTLLYMPREYSRCVGWRSLLKNLLMPTTSDFLSVEARRVVVKLADQVDIGDPLEPKR